MSEFLVHKPGLLFVIATLLPLASFVLLLILGGIRNFARSSREGTFGATVYHLLGGPTPGRAAAYIATAAIGLAFVASLTGAILFQTDSTAHAHAAPAEQGHGHKKAEKKVDKWSDQFVW